MLKGHWPFAKYRWHELSQRSKEKLSHLNVNVCYIHIKLLVQLPTNEQGLWSDISPRDLPAYIKIPLQKTNSLKVLVFSLLWILSLTLKSDEETSHITSPSVFPPCLTFLHCRRLPCVPYRAHLTNKFDIKTSKAGCKWLDSSGNSNTKQKHCKQRLFFFLTIGN